MGIQLSKISKSFGQPPVRVLSEIHLDIKDGEFVAVTGRSGSGKSTLLYIMSTLDSPTEGSNDIDGVDMLHLSQKDLHQFRNQHMGFVFQFHHLLPELSALENVLMPSLKRNLRKERSDFAAHLLEEFGLGTKLDRLPGQLSGGEQQRVAIARALVMEPKYLFADEPTGNLDSVNGMAVMNILRQINKSRNMTVIYVTHDHEFANMATRQIHLVDGKLANTDQSAL